MAKCSCYYQHGLKTVCYGTKEMEVCSCGGDESKCNFYPEKRKPKMATEKRYIDANALLEFALNRYNKTIIPSDIESFPTVDAVKVVHGRWENITGGMVVLGDCSECKVRQPVIGTNYCNNCGADMRERKEK